MYITFKAAIAKLLDDRLDFATKDVTIRLQILQPTDCVIAVTLMPDLILLQKTSLFGCKFCNNHIILLI